MTNQTSGPTSGYTLPGPVRHDYAFPLRIDPGSGQVARAGYADHVQQLIRQLLLTSPGERVCRPDVGCGLRRMVFAPQTEGLAATAHIHLRQALTTWLPDQVALTDVSVLTGADPDNDLDQGELLITVSYVLVDTQTAAAITVRVV